MKSLAAIALAFSGLLLGQEMPPPVLTGGLDPGYGGPTILSRRQGTQSLSGEGLFQLRPYVQLQGIYDTGLMGVFIPDPSGRLPQTDACGGRIAVGALGYHSWNKTVLGLDYRGNYNRYTPRSAFDGTDQSLSLVLTHQATRRVGLELIQSAASYRGGYMGLAGTSFFDPSFSAITEGTLFDSRTNVLMSTGRVVFQKTARLSFSAAGSGSILSPRSPALVDHRAVQAVGDTAYRLGRFQTIGASYSYQRMDYPNAFGTADVHGVAMHHSIQIGRPWEFRISLGGYRVETLRLQQVAIDPAIAAIIGQGIGVESFHRVLYSPHIGANLTRRFRYSFASASYERGITPGNGVYMTSGHETARISYSYSGRSRVHFGADAGRSTYRSFAQSISPMRSYTGGAGIGLRIARYVDLTTRFDGRTFSLPNTGFDRTFYRTTVGLTFRPGEMPVALW